MLMSQPIARPDLCTSVELCCRMQSTRGCRKSFNSNYVGWELNMRNPQHQDWSQTHKAPGPLHKLCVSHYNTTWPNNYVNKVKAALKSLVTITSSVSTPACRPSPPHSSTVCLPLLHQLTSSVQLPSLCTSLISSSFYPAKLKIHYNTKKFQKRCTEWKITAVT